MGVKKSLTRLIAGALIACSSVSANAGDYRASEFNFGVEGTVGFNNGYVKAPNGEKTITVTGNTGLISSPRVKTYTLEIPTKSKYGDDELAWGIAPYIAHYSDNTWEMFKIGKELVSGEQSCFLVGKSDNSYGVWPNVGVSADTKIENILYLEKTFLKGGESRSNVGLSFLLKLNQYETKYTAFTARTPYGAEWYKDFENTITSRKDLGTKKGLALIPGIRASISARNELDMLFGLMLEGSYGIPLNNFIEPTWDVRLGLNMGW